MKKLWSRLSISKKLFILTIFVFSLFLAFLFFGQLFFFEKYYSYTIRQNLIETVDEFSEEYKTLDTDDDINASIVRYSNDSDSFIMVSNENNEILHTVSYELRITAASGEQMTFVLDNAFRDDAFLNLNLKEGDTVTVEYNTNSHRSKFYIPHSISTGSNTWTSTQAPPFSQPPRPGQDDRPGEENHFESMLQVTGVVDSISLPTMQNSRLNIQRNEAFGASMDWMVRIHNGFQMELDSPVHYVYESPESGNTYSVVAKLIDNNGAREIIFAITPMRSVTEAVNIIRDLVGIWFVFTVVMALVISLVFSRTVTKPIASITDITKKMSNLDFSRKCAVKSEDEIGNLALHVNLMSEKLDAAIDELVKTNEQLVGDINRERELEQQRKEFVATVSHELKTPLAIIRAYSEGLLDGVSQEKQNRYLHVIVDETAKMDALILDMLENSKLETGAQKLDLKMHDLTAFADSIVKIIAPACASKGVQLTAHLPEQRIERKFDKVLLEQVIMNFLTNAIRHTAPGGTIFFTVSPEEVSVENEGPHIPEAELPKVWDRFYRVEKSRGRTDGGSGLGLTIAKNILLLHHAEYGVENTAAGVRFWFRLPAAPTR